MNRIDLGPYIPAMVTPFDGAGRIDLKQMQAFCERMIKGGVSALLVCGTTGESPTIAWPDKLELFKTCVEAAAGRVPVIANVGDNCTADTIEFARQAQAAGVDAIMCVVPYYNKPPQRGMYAHFAAIAEAVDLPMVLYNIPGRSVVNMEAATTLALARDHANIVAIKEASGNLEQIKAIIEGAPQGFKVYSGEDSDTLEVMRLGGYGVISTVANVACELMNELVCACQAAVRSGDWNHAHVLHTRLLPLMHELFVTSNPIMVKAALNLSGFNVGGLRLPLIEASDKQVAELSKVMKEIGVL